MKQKGKLTPKQLMFCKEYLIDLNAKEAATRAGYSSATAKELGYKLLRSSAIQDKIARLMNDRSKRTELTSDYVLRELLSIAKDDIRNYVKITSEGGKVILQLNDIQESDKKNIAEISQNKDGQLRFKLYSRENALIQLGRHLGLFNDKVNLNVSEEIMALHKKVMTKK